VFGGARLCDAGVDRSRQGAVAQPHGRRRGSRRLRAANIQVAAGAINQPPATSLGGFEIAVQTLGRLSSPEQFSEIVVATGDDGAGDPGTRQSPGSSSASQDYTTNGLSRQPGRHRHRDLPNGPGSKRIGHGRGLFAPPMEDLAKDFPAGMAYRVVYNTTEFIQQSVDEVIKDAVRGGRAGRDRDHRVPAELGAAAVISDRRHPGVR